MFICLLLSIFICLLLSIFICLLSSTLFICLLSFWITLLDIKLFFGKDSLVKSILPRDWFIFGIVSLSLCNFFNLSSKLDGSSSICSGTNNSPILFRLKRLSSLLLLDNPSKPLLNWLESDVLKSGLEPFLVLVLLIINSCGFDLFFCVCFGFKKSGVVGLLSCDKSFCLFFIILSIIVLTSCLSAIPLKLLKGLSSTLSTIGRNTLFKTGSKLLLYSFILVPLIPPIFVAIGRSITWFCFPCDELNSLLNFKSDGDCWWLISIEDFLTSSIVSETAIFLNWFKIDSILLLFIFFRSMFL